MCKTVTQGSLFYLDPFQRQYLPLRRALAYVARYTAAQRPWLEAK